MGFVFFLIRTTKLRIFRVNFLIHFFPRPEKIENIFQRSEFVVQIFVYGDSLKSFLVSSKVFF